MALKIESLRKELQGGEYVSDYRLCVDAEGNIVKETDPKAIRLLVGKGGTMSREDAQRYGLIANKQDTASNALGSESTRPNNDNHGESQSKRKQRKETLQDKALKASRGDK